MVSLDMPAIFVVVHIGASPMSTTISKLNIQDKYLNVLIVLTQLDGLDFLKDIYQMAIRRELDML